MVTTLRRKDAAASQAEGTRTGFDVQRSTFSSSSVLRRASAKIRPQKSDDRPTPIHCARPPHNMAFRPLLRQVSKPDSRVELQLTRSQRAVVPAMAAALTTGAVFAPRAVYAEEQPGDAFVRLHATAH